VYCGNLNNSGKVFKFGANTYYDDGIAFQCSFRTKTFDFGYSSKFKRGKWLAITMKAEGQTVITTGKDETSGVNFVNGEATKKTYKVPGPGYFRVLNLEFQYLGDKEFVFQGIELIMHLKRSVIKAFT
jgi:hypothetical protein